MDEHSLKIERRQVPRYKAALETKFKFLDLKRPLTYEAAAGDIGEGGLFINRIFKEEELGKHLDLEIELPGTQIVVKTLAQVRWIKRSLQENKILGLGVRFTEIFPEEKRKLESYVANLAPYNPLKIKSVRPPDAKLADREKRNLEILSVLRRQSPVSKTQIAQELDLNIVTISNYIEEFKKKGIIFERGFDESSGGRRPSLLELNAEYGFLVGAELNFSKGYATLLAADFSLRTLAKRSIWLKDGAHNLHDGIIGMVSEVIRDSDVDRSRIVGMGLGLSGSDGMHDPNLREILEDKIGLPVLIEDSSVANIFAEKWLNLDLARAENILYVGVGVGSDSDFGMMIRGEVYRGAGNGKLRMWFGSAETQGQSDTRSCWSNKECILREETERLTSANAAELGTRFGARIAFLLNLFRPEIVIVGGVPQEVQETFFESLRQVVTRWSFNGAGKTVRIIPAQLGKDSVALGMAALLCRDVYSRV